MWISTDENNRVTGWGQTKQDFFQINTDDEDDYFLSLKFRIYDPESNRCFEDAESLRNCDILNIENAVESLIESIAQKKGYKNSNRLMGYIGDPNPVWDAEARAFRAWRSNVWQYCIRQREQSDSSSSIPTIEEFISNLVHECNPPW